MYWFLYNFSYIECIGIKNVDILILDVSLACNNAKNVIVLSNDSSLNPYK